MVRAEDLKIRVNQAKADRYARVAAQVEEIISGNEEKMLRAASDGLTTYFIKPYENFTCDRDKVTAQEVFTKILKDAGYTINENDWGQNRLVFSW